MKFDKELFSKYIDMLLKWQKKINLISNNTINDLWNRHFLDSLHLYDYVKNKNGIFDIGSGAGFPGMVLSITGIKNITLVESDKRKCIFLNQIKNLYNLDINIISNRVEELEYCNVNCIIGRAFAPLTRFIDLCSNIISKDTEFYLLKGNSVDLEIKELYIKYKFDYKLFKLKEGFVIYLTNIINK